MNFYGKNHLPGKNANELGAFLETAIGDGYVTVALCSKCSYSVSSSAVFSGLLPYVLEHRLDDQSVKTHLGGYLLLGFCR